MSLDVWLELESRWNPDAGQKIVVREDGRNKEISREEWDARFPGVEPFTVEVPEDDPSVFHWNITHNLGKMAKAAGLYYPMWRPEEIGATVGADLTVHLAAGIKVLKADPEKFREYNPENGWGTYEHLVEFAEEYLKACIQWPDAKIRTWR